MIEKILGKEELEDIFYSSMLTGLMTEKQAQAFVGNIEKRAQISDIAKFSWGAGKDLIGGTSTALKTIPAAAGWTMLAGASAGALGTMAYDALKERLTHADPETKHNTDVEAMYENKAQELEDAKWLARVRALRDELRRGMKKMTLAEYRDKYNALVAALEERRG